MPQFEESDLRFPILHLIFLTTRDAIVERCNERTRRVAVRGRDGRHVRVRSRNAGKFEISTL